MKININRFFGIVAICFLFAVGTASAQSELCFENEGLKNIHKVSFSVTDKTVAGTFVITTYDESEPEKTFEFTGTKTGTQLTVKFTGETPYELPPRTKAIVWTLSSSKLVIPIYGKNYQTNKYSTANTDYVKCGQE